jgi:hypothetical protein
MLDTFDLIKGGSFIVAAVPQDFDNASVNGVWASMKNAAFVDAFVICAVAGTAGTGPVITLEQATSIAGAGAKELLITELNYVAAADITAAAANVDWTAATADRTTPIESWDADDVGGDELELIVHVRISQGMFDADNDFAFFRVKTVNGNSDAARLGAIIYVCKDKLTKGDDVPSLQS